MSPLSRLLPAAIAAAVTVALLAPAAAAAESPRGMDVESLLRRVEELERAVRELKESRPPCNDAAASETGTAPQPEPRDGAPAEARPPVTTASEKPAKPLPPVRYDDGIILSSEDGDYALRLNGFVQADSRWFIDDNSNGGTDQFFIRRARIDLRATIAKRFQLRLVPDFAGSSLSLQDAYMDVKFAPWLTVRAGKAKTPVGLERLQSSTDLVFIERSLVDNVVPNRDIGVQLTGDLAGGLVSYAAGVFNGAPDGSSVEGDVNDAVDGAGRVFAHPFRNTEWQPVKSLGIGVGGSYGREQGSTTSPQLPTFRTSSRVPFFRYSATDAVVADGEHWRVSPQAYWYFGPVGMMGEYAVSGQEIASAVDAGHTVNQAWQVYVSWLLTGEEASYKGVEPAQDFDFGGGGWGAWQIAVRYHGLDVDGDTFDKGFADPAASAGRVDSVTAALNWYLNETFKLNLNYEHSNFDAGAPAGARDEEDVFLSRAQLQF